MKSNGPILVGVDGSEQAQTAAWWAVAEAGLRGAEVHLVVVNDHPPRDDELWAMVQALGSRLRTEHPQVAVHERIARGHPADRLIRRSAKARMVVVGARGRTAFTTAMLGSVSTKVATHARCPVVVVRDYRTSGPVVVGMDGSPSSKAALQFAFDAAAVHRTSLVAVKVWQEGTREHAKTEPPPDRQDAAKQVQRDLAELLDGWVDKYPNVAVHQRVPCGHPVAELTKAAHDARMLAVGHRGRGGFGGLLLGSVASGVLHHAACPVMVVRDEAQ